MQPTENLAKQLAGLAPSQRAHLVPRIALLGGESTGKSTLAAALCQALGSSMVREFGREYWVAKKGLLTSADMQFIALRQSRLERLAAARATGYLICDTTPLTTLFYHRWTLSHHEPPPLMLHLAEQRYELTVLCGDEIPHKQDGTRDSAAFRSRQQSDYRTYLQGLTTPWVEVRGSVAARVAHVQDALAVLNA